MSLHGVLELNLNEKRTHHLSFFARSNVWYVRSLNLYLTKIIHEPFLRNGTKGSHIYHHRNGSRMGAFNSLIDRGTQTTSAAKILGLGTAPKGFGGSSKLKMSKILSF